MFSPHPSYMNSQETKREWSLRSWICFIHCNWIATQNAVTRQEKDSLGDIWLHRHVLRDTLWISGQIASSSDKGFSIFSSWIVAEVFPQLATWLWFSDTTSFFEKHSEKPSVLLALTPCGKTCQCQGRGGDVYYMQQLGGSLPTRNEVQGSHMLLLCSLFWMSPKDPQKAAVAIALCCRFFVGVSRTVF